MNEFNETGQTPQGDSEYTELSHTWFHPWKNREITCAYRFREPSQAEINRYTKEAGKGSAATAHTNLLVSIVHPDNKAQMLADFKAYPGLAPALGNWALKASGFNDLGN